MHRESFSGFKYFVSLIYKTFIFILFVIAAVFTLPRFLDYRVYAVISGSMEPTYPVGSVVFVKEILPNEIKIGDCITYNYVGEYVTHRVVDMENGIFYTKGDANEHIDMPVNFNQLIGFSKEIYLPYIGYIAIWVHEKKLWIGFTLCICIIFGLLSKLKRSARVRTGRL